MRFFITFFPIYYNIILVVGTEPLVVLKIKMHKSTKGFQIININAYILNSNSNTLIYQHVQQ